MVLPFTMIGKEARRKRFERRNRFLFRSCQLGDVYAYLMDIWSKQFWAEKRILVNDRLWNLHPQRDTENTGLEYTSPRENEHGHLLTLCRVRVSRVLTVCKAMGEYMDEGLMRDFLASPRHTSPRGHLCSAWWDSLPWTQQSEHRHYAGDLSPWALLLSSSCTCLFGFPPRKLQVWILQSADWLRRGRWTLTWPVALL